MSIDTTVCEAYFQGEIRPIIFEIFTESGVPFKLIDEFVDQAEGPVQLNDKYAFCLIKNESGEIINSIPISLIESEPAKKVMLCSWDTGSTPVGYYRLQVWVSVNISGELTQYGDPIIQAKLASEELTRYVKI